MGKQPEELTNFRLPFGLRPGDILNLIMVVGACAVFVFKTDDRISALEKATAYLSSYAEASDGWHSTVIGTQFKGGKPINTNFDPTPIKRAISKEQQ